MSEWNSTSKGFLPLLALLPNRSESEPNQHFFFPYSRQSPNLFDTKPSTNSYQRFSHSDSALFFSVPARVENWNEKRALLKTSATETARSPITAPLCCLV